MDQPNPPATDSNPHFQVRATVFWPAAIIVIGFVALSLIFFKDMEAAFTAVQTTIAEATGWFFVAVVDFFLIVVIYLLFSRFGHIRLGGAGSRPEFTTWTWFAMLFSAGMGIGLVFFAVAEPIYHFMAPAHTAVAELSAPVRAERAMRMTFYHWGLHAWGIYCLVGLSLAYFCFNRGLPLTIRSLFYPLLKERIHGWMGDVVDVLASVATLFGVATSLGIGVQQINAGINHLTGVGSAIGIQVALIAVITLFATISVVTGVKRGIRFLSELNMGLAGTLLLLVLIAGPTGFILDSLVQNIGGYLQHLTALSTWTEAYQRTEWQNDWTIFYWAWWIAWSPFVGMFIARISRGRTIREFVAGVLLVPTALTFVWLTVFGNAALHSEVFGQGGISEAVSAEFATAMFVLLEQFPFARVTCVLAIIVVVLFFVTSSDSGSLVIDIITSGGNQDPPVGQRIFWAVLEGVVAAVLLIGGGLKALQTASILTGLPFAIVLFFMVFSLLKGLRTDPSLAPLPSEIIHDEGLPTAPKIRELRKTPAQRIPASETAER